MIEQLKNKTLSRRDPFWVEEEEAAWSATLCVAVTSVGAVEEMGSLKVTGMEAKHVMIAI